MSRTIWTQCGGESSAAPLSTRAWRVVEAQHVVSTLKLVDSLEEQRILEAQLERVKPPRPGGPEFAHLHWLLYTPFRYPPLREGSRFGGRHEPGLWYGADALPTALAEKAYRALALLADTEAPITVVERLHTAFEVPIRTAHGVDLTQPPFAKHERRISSPTTYRWSQPLGRAMREAGIQACRYRSARDPEKGTNLAVLHPGAFARRSPEPRTQTWVCIATREAVTFTRRGMARPIQHRFPRETFLVEDGFPYPPS